MAKAGGCGQKAGPGRDRGRDVFIRGAEESSRGIHEKWMQRKADGEGAGVSNTANIGELVLGRETDRTAQGKVREGKGIQRGTAARGSGVLFCPRDEPDENDLGTGAAHKTGRTSQLDQGI